MSGQIVRPEQLARLGRVVGQGQEHQVRVLSGGELVSKITVAGRGGFGITPYLRGSNIGLRPGTPAEYLNRLALQNEIFCDDIRFTGIYEASNGNSRIITSQPFIKGGRPTAAEIARFMQSLGFAPVAGQEGNVFYRSLDNAAVFDAHEGNLIKTGYGIVPIDVAVVHPDDRLLEVLEKGIEG